jgi:hypothetical protein
MRKLFLVFGAEFIDANYCYQLVGKLKNSIVFAIDRKKKPQAILLAAFHFFVLKV